MVQVLLQTDPGFLMGQVRLRARSIEPVAQELLSSILMVLGSDANEWKFHQFRTGGNSFALYRPGKEFHFRYYHQGEIVVKDSYVHGTVIARLKTRKDARDFVAGLTP